MMKAIVEQSNGIVVSVRYFNSENEHPKHGGAPDQGGKPEPPKKEKNAKR